MLVTNNISVEVSPESLEWFDSPNVSTVWLPLYWLMHPFCIQILFKVSPLQMLHQHLDCGLKARRCCCQAGQLYPELPQPLLVHQQVIGYWVQMSR
jgi:hypothetical protein